MPRARLVFDGDWVYTEKEARIHKLTEETETKIDNIPGVVDDVNSDSTTDALSAHMGKVLQNQINNLAGVGTFLSNWDCTTGLPESDPQVDPYTYKAWNYYIVSKVADLWWTNYKPHWAQYNQWVASVTVETWEISMNDWYIYDGSQWLIQPAWNRTIVIDDALSPTSRNAVENRAVYSALSQKQTAILDLGTIREWAAAWATALQPWDNITELTNNAGYQTAGDVAAAIEQLAPHWVWEWVLTLQKNSSTLDTFSANAAQNKTINITVPTTVAELSDASDYVTDTELSTTLEDYATKTYVDWNVIHSWPTAPSPATEWMLWYDTVNDVLKVYDWTNWNLTWKVYSAWTWINISANDEISNTWVLSINGSTWAITWIATEQYVDDAVSDSKYIWPFAPRNPTQWMLWYDTVGNVLKVYNWSGWVTFQELLVNWVNIKTINNHDLLWSWNIDIIWVEEIQFVTQAEYDALPSTKLSDWKAYFIYSWHWAAIVSDEAFWSTWDWITTQAPSKNAIYDKITDIEWNKISVEWASLWSYLTACVNNWTAHTISFWDITYTMQWIGYIRVGMMYWARLRINWVEIFNEYFSSWNYHEKYHLGPYTVSQWDVIEIDRPWWGWAISGAIYDYYNE